MANAMNGHGSTAGKAGRHGLMFLLALALALVAGGVGRTTAAADLLTSPSNFNLVGDAAWTGGILRLTTADPYQAGAAWYQTKLPVGDGFDTTFQFQIAPSAGADGFAFVIQNQDDKAIGGSGGYIGFGDSPSGQTAGSGITDSIAVKFDTYQNLEFGDPNDNFLSVQTRGHLRNSVDSAASLGSTSKIPLMTDGNPHTVRIVYQAASLQIYMDDPNTPVLTVSADLANLLTLDQGTAWAGFTAGTGADYENHDILSWSFGTVVPPAPPSAVNDLKAKAHSTTSIDLTWTAPGSSGATGQADHYDIRYSTSPLTDANFASATAVANPPKPQPVGSQEAFTVPGLSPQTHYWFALKAFDAAGHVSPLSNVADAFTLGPPPHVLATSPKDGDTGVDVAAPLVVTFDQPMNPSTVQLVLSPTVAHLVPSWSADGKTVTYAHDPFLGDGASYTATVAQGQDQNGDPLAGPVSFSFLTFKAPGGLAETPWPMYRHDPTHSGRNAFAGPSGTPTGPTWSAPVPSRFSSPSVGIDRTIYVGSQGDGLVAVNPDGTIKWKALAGALAAGDWVKSSPAIAKDGTIYIGLPNGELHAIAPDGANQWTQPLQGAIVSSPAVGDDGTVYVGANNTLYAVTPGGRIEWQFQTFGAIFSSPAVGPDGTVYVGAEDGGLYAIVGDASQPSGSRELWVAQTTGGVRSSPVVTDGAVYVGSLDHGFYAFDPTNHGAQLWSFTADSDIDASAALGADGTLYVASVNGTLYALDKNGKQVWSVDTGQEIDGSPSLDKNGVVYLGTSSPDETTGRLYAFDPVTGNARWKLDVPSPISSSPIIGADGTLYVGSGNSLLLVGAAQAALVPGDVNGDGKVTLADATLALRIAVGLVSPSPGQVAAGDLDRDGKIDAVDVTKILMIVVGL